MSRLVRFLLGFFLLGLLAQAAESHVQVSLIAATSHLVPGEPLKVGLRLDHAEHWHTYWKNPGTGLATSVDWQLPPGWSASSLDWPAPKLILNRLGAITGMGYDGTTLLIATLTPPSDLRTETPILLRATVRWLLCNDETCIPGQAKVELALHADTRPAAPGPSADLFQSALRPQAPHASFQAQAFRDSRGVRLRFQSETAPTDLRFFPEDEFFAYDKPQPFARDGTTSELLILEGNPGGETAPAILRGVLSSSLFPNGLLLELPVASQPPPPLPTAPVSTPAGPERSLPALLLLALLGGLILNLMPCVFPVLGIKILGFVNQAGSDRRKIVFHGLAFTGGVVLSFWILAGTLALLKAGGAQLGWGFQLQSPAFVLGLAFLLFAFALSLSGVCEFGLSATAVGSDLQSRDGLLGSFFTGVLATVVATPCSAPFLAPALGAALSLGALDSFLLFTAIAIGLSTPYLLLSIFPAAVRFLPRPGAWMETFRQAMAFPLYATVGYLVWVLAGQLEEYAFRSALFSLVLLAAAVWLYGRATAPSVRKPSSRRLGVLGALALLTAAGLLGWPRDKAPGSVTWEPWSAERVTALRAEGRIIYVDFTARWCATCQTNKQLVFGSDKVLRAFADKKVAALRADWTNNDPAITAELARWGRSAVPFNLLYLPGKPEPVILPELLGPDTVLEALP